jgi:hypothetical protein
MTNVEFRTKLTEAFNTHMFMKDRNRHTVNELLYVLTSDGIFDYEYFNISVCKTQGGCLCIPSLDVFVPVKQRGIWFDDSRVEFEVEELGEEKFNCITIYESEEN